MWHKARSMRHPVRTELTNNGLQTQLGSHYTHIYEQDTTQRQFQSGGKLIHIQFSFS